MKSRDICLVVIYNHNYEKNIPVIDRIYAGRFGHVYHVMPFYRGTDPHVIGVYENSYQFNGYITQAWSRLKNERYSHYVAVADDMVLNPKLNETNLVERLGLGEHESFVGNYRLMDDERFMNWISAIPSVMNLLGGGNSCEGQRFLPSIEEARTIFERHGLDWRNGLSTRLFNIVRCGCRVMRQTASRYTLLPPLGFLRKHPHLFSSDTKTYPLVDGYSDFFVVPQSCMENFVHYSGLFAALRVFVEISIPTSLLFSSSQVKTLADTIWKAENGIDDYGVRSEIEKSADFDYRLFVEKFPKDYLYIHPVKLSKWRNLP